MNRNSLKSFAVVPLKGINSGNSWKAEKHRLLTGNTHNTHLSHTHTLCADK